MEESRKFLEVEQEEPADQRIDFKTEVKLYANIAFPTAFTGLIASSQWLVTTSVAGSKLGTDALAAISLTMLAGNLLGRSFALGILSGSDTLNGRAVGEQNFQELGFLAQRSLLSISIIWICCSFLWMNIAKIFDIFDMNQPQEVVELTQKFLKRYIFIFPGEMLTEITLGFYRAQNVCVPFTVILSVSMGCHFVFVHVFASHFGFDGIILAHFSTAYLNLTLCWTYALVSKSHHPMSLPRIDFNEVLNSSKIRTFFSLAIPGMLSMSEWWFGETLTVLAAKIDEPSLAAHSIVFNLLNYLFILFYGPTLAAQTRISTVLTEKKPMLARNIARGTVAVDLTLGILAFFAFLLFKDTILSAFLKDDEQNEEVTQRIDDVWLLVAIFHIIHSILASSFGIFRGAGLHGQLAKIMIVVLWCFGFPFELVVSFKSGLGLYGLYVAFTIIYFAIDVALVAYILNIKWEQYVPVPNASLK